MNFFSIIFNACFGFRSYVRFLDIPYRSSLKYLAQLVLLLTAVVVLTSLPGVASRIDTLADFVDRKFPKFAMRDGAVWVPPGQEAPASGTGARVVLELPEATALDLQAEPEEGDVNGAAVTAPKTYPDLVIQQDGLVIRRETLDALVAWAGSNREFEWPARAGSAAAAGPVKHIKFSELGLTLPDGAFTGQYLRSVLRNLLVVAVPVVYLLMAAVGFLVCFLQSQLFASFYSALESQGDSRLTHKQLLNLATYSVTPAAIIVTVYQAFHLEGLPMIYLVAYGVFLFGATNACRPRKEEATADDSEFY